MTITVGINGFGRIGRSYFRALLTSGADIRVAAVNDLTSAQTLANLLKYDSVYGPLPQQVVAEGASIRIGDTVVEVLSERDPAQLPWRRLGVDVVMESTGVFNDAAKARAHIDAGASKVVVSAAAKNADLTLVIGVNDDLYDPEKHTIVSNASCTTNCLAPMARVLDDALGIECGTMTTIHAYTQDQYLQDGPHRDPRRARAANLSTIPVRSASWSQA